MGMAEKLGSKTKTMRILIIEQRLSVVSRLVVIKQIIFVMYD
jgi:hypothetical protein